MVEQADIKQSRRIGHFAGKALIGHKKGDKVTVEVPNGTLEFKIVEITR